MKLISDCIELNPNGMSSIIEEANVNESIDCKDVILNYLKNGIDAGVCCSVVVDRITGENLPRTIHRYKDDEYIWSDEDIYHFEKYNIKLVKEFVDKILLSTQQ